MAEIHRGLVNQIQNRLRDIYSVGSAEARSAKTVDVGGYFGINNDAASAISLNGFSHRGDLIWIARGRCLQLASTSSQKLIYEFQFPLVSSANI